MANGEHHLVLTTCSYKRRPTVAGEYGQSAIVIACTNRHRSGGPRHVNDSLSCVVPEVETTGIAPSSERGHYRSRRAFDAYCSASATMAQFKPVCGRVKFSPDCPALNRCA